MSRAFTFATAFGLWASAQASASFSQNFEKARYMYEIEGNASAALRALDLAENSAQGQEKERVKLLRLEIQFAKGKTKEVRHKLGQIIAHSSIPQKHLRKIQKRLGMDTLYQKVNLAQYQFTQLDTLLSWQGEHILSYQNGMWQRWGKKLDPSQSSPGSKFLFANGKYLYSAEASRKKLWVKSLQSEEEDQSFDLGQPFSWSQGSGDRLLLWSGNQLTALRGKRKLWTWQSPLGWCELASDHEEQLLLSCPRGHSLVLLEPESAKWSRINLPRTPLGAIQVPMGLIYFDEQGLSRMSSANQKEIWRQNLSGISQVKLLGTQILVKTREQLHLVESRDGKILRSIPTKGQHLSLLDQRIVLWKDNGYLSFWNHNLEALWEFQLGQGLKQEPVQINDNIFVIGKNGHGILLDGHFNGLQPTEQDGLLQKANEAKQKNNLQEAYAYAQKALLLEPGNAKAKLFNLENTAKPPSFADLYQTLIQSGEDSLLQSATLSAMKDLSGSLWIANLGQEHTAFPQFRYKYGKMWWIHPEKSLLQTMHLNNGSLQSYSRTNSYPGLLQPMDLSATQIVVAAGRHLDFYSTAGNYLFSSAELPEAPLWVGHFGKQVVRVGRSGSISYLDPNGVSQAFLPALDHSAVMQIQRSGEVMDLFYRSGAWFRSIPKTRQWVHRKTAGNVESAWSDESQALISTSERVLYSYGFDGAEQWQSELPAQAISIQAYGDKVLVGLSNQKLLVLNRKNGEALWTFQGNSSLFVRPLVLGNELYLDQGQKLIVLSLADGRKLRERSYPFRIGTIQSDGTTLLITSASGLVLAYSPGQI